MGVIDRSALRGPFDLIGDVHGCIDELRSLLERLGGRVVGACVEPAPGRTLVLLGDLVDRGPGVAEVLELVMPLVASGRALCLLGNHEHKLLRALKGANVKVTRGLDVSLAALARRPRAFNDAVVAFLEGLAPHVLLDDGALVAAHAGISAELIGRDTGQARSFALYGPTTGTLDEQGMPDRVDWAVDYTGDPFVVYGHTPQREAIWRGRTTCIDTGCVFGGHLTALRWPERAFVQTPALRAYAPLHTHQAFGSAAVTHARDSARA
jgi:protein phosphatase